MFEVRLGYEVVHSAVALGKIFSPIFNVNNRLPKNSKLNIGFWPFTIQYLPIFLELLKTKHPHQENVMSIVLNKEVSRCSKAGIAHSRTSMRCSDDSTDSVIYTRLQATLGYEVWS